MGYNTTFDGYIRTIPALTKDMQEYLRAFSRSRRISRDTHCLIAKYKGEFGLNGSYGKDGEFFVGDDEFSCSSSYNDPPSTQPSLWCQWIPGFENDTIEWDGEEKFYCGFEWMKYIIDNILAPNGYICNGEIYAYGEDYTDIWMISVKNNVVKKLLGEINYVEED